jgi:hypothetical protein
MILHAKSSIITNLWHTSGRFGQEYPMLREFVSRWQGEPIVLVRESSNPSAAHHAWLWTSTEEYNKLIHKINKLINMQTHRNHNNGYTNPITFTYQTSLCSVQEFNKIENSTK